MGLGVRGLGLFGVGLLLSTGTFAQVQQQQSVSTENAVAVPSTTGGDAERPAPAERDPHYTIYRDDVRLISFPLPPKVKQSLCSTQWIRRTAERWLHVQGRTRPGLVDAVKKGVLECTAGRTASG